MKTFKNFIKQEKINEISSQLKARYLKQAIEDLEWMAGAAEYNGGDYSREQEKRRKNLHKLIDQLAKATPVKEAALNERSVDVHKNLKSVVRDMDDTIAFLRKKKFSPREHGLTTVEIQTEFNKDVRRLEAEWRNLAQTIREFWGDWEPDL